jgi:hypothetical protein
MSFYWNNTRPSGFTRWSCSTVQIVDFSMPLAPASLVVGPTFEVAVIIIFSILKLPVLFNFIQFSVLIFSGSVWPAVRFYPVFFWPEWTVVGFFIWPIFFFFFFFSINCRCGMFLLSFSFSFPFYTINFILFFIYLSICLIVLVVVRSVLSLSFFFPALNVNYNYRHLFIKVYLFDKIGPCTVTILFFNYFLVFFCILLIPTLSYISI